MSDTQTCYRHPNREAPLGCTRCGRPICLDDAIDAPVGFLCPECARQPARVRRMAHGAANPTVTIGLVGLLVVVYLLQGRAPLIARFATSGAAIADGEWWRILTGTMLHIGILHIAFNAYLLYLLGQMLEPRLGSDRFLALYVTGGVMGSAGAVLLSWGTPSVGASGAVFGLMGAALVLMRRAGVNPWQTQIGSLVIINLIFTFTFRGISVGGHLGGLVGGAAAAAVMLATEKRGHVASLLAIVGVAAVGVGLALAAAQLGGP